MKVRIGSYDVEINAKNWVLEEEETETETTLHFLNELALVYWESASYNKSKYYSCADELDSIARHLHNICKENGLYEGQK